MEHVYPISRIFRLVKPRRHGNLRIACGQAFRHVGRRLWTEKSSRWLQTRPTNNPASPVYLPAHYVLFTKMASRTAVATVIFRSGTQRSRMYCNYYVSGITTDTDTAKKSQSVVLLPQFPGKRFFPFTWRVNYVSRRSTIHGCLNECQGFLCWKDAYTLESLKWPSTTTVHEKNTLWYYNTYSVVTLLRVQCLLNIEIYLDL